MEPAHILTDDSDYCITIYNYILIHGGWVCAMFVGTSYKKHHFEVGKTLK